MEEFGSDFSAETMLSGGKKFSAGGMQKKAPCQSSPCTPATKVTVAIADTPSDGTPSSRAHLKLPSGDSPYVRAKHVQLVEKDPAKAIPLFWAAINSGDRLDSAVKDMAVVMKQVNRTEEAIEAIKSFRHLCSTQAQEPLDNVLLDLYKKCNRIDDQIELLNFKLKMIDKRLAFGGRTAKIARSQGKRFLISLDEEKSRLLGNLAWAYMQSGNYREAEAIYRTALEIEVDYNKQCNLAICLMQIGRVSEAKSLLQNVTKPSGNSSTVSYLNSYKRASEMLMTLERQLCPSEKHEEKKLEAQSIPASVSTAIDNQKYEGFTGENLNSTKFLKELNEVSSPFLVSPKNVTPSEIMEGRWVGRPGLREVSAGIYNRDWNCEAISSPESFDRSLKYFSRLLVSGENNSEKSIDCNMTSERPRADIETEEYLVEDCNLKPKVTNQPPTPAELSQDRASKGQGTGSSLATVNESSNPRYENMVMGSRRQEHGREEEAVSVIGEKGRKQSFDKASVTNIENLKPPAQGYTDTSGERGKWTNHAMEKLATSDARMPKPSLQSYTSKRSVWMDATNEKNVHNMKPLTNKNQDYRSDILIRGNQRSTETGEEVALGKYLLPPPQNLELDCKSALMSENMRPAQDYSVLTSDRRPQAKHKRENCRAEDDIRKPNLLIRSPTIIPRKAPKKLSGDRLVSFMNVNFSQASNPCKGNEQKMVISEEKLPFGGPKNDQCQNSDSTLSPITENALPIVDTSVVNGRKTWADMVEEEECLTNDNLSNDAASDHTFRSSKISSEEHFGTPPVWQRGRSALADMVKEEEFLSKENLNTAAAYYNIGGRDSSQENIKASSVMNTRRKTWADLVEEEEECLGSENAIKGTTIDSRNRSCNDLYVEQPALKSSVSFEKWNDFEEYQDENENVNIARSTLRWRNQMPKNYTDKVCRKLNMAKLKEWSETDSRTKRRNASAQRSLLFD